MIGVHAPAAALLVLAAGAAHAAPPARFAAAMLMPDADADASSASAVTARSGGKQRARRAGHVGVRKQQAADPIEAAARAATREPTRAGFANAAQVYAFAEGAVYRLYTAPERVSDIALEPGERLIAVAAGDTARWVIGDTTSGAEALRRTHLLVKPSASGLRTNLVITTDRRVYHVALESNARAAMTSISWTYPQDALLALRAGERAAAAAAPVASAAIESLNFGYRIGGDAPPWRPVRAFDDGRQVFIEFPASLAAGEAPPLFVVGEGGRAELVNYRLRGRYYVVDRLFAAAELRLGDKRQQVVRITRQGGNEQRRRRGGRSD